MASSYVEVRESENGTEGSMLQFEIDPCENNGSDSPQHIEGEPPKDHTYNKEPEIMEFDDSGSVTEEKEQELEVKEEGDDPLKKSKQNQKNTKQKIGKTQTSEKYAKSPVKRDIAKRTVARKQMKDDGDVMKSEEHGIKNDVAHEETITDAKDTEIAALHVPKKRGRKRKAHDNSFDEINAKQSEVPEESTTEKELAAKKEDDPPAIIHTSNETNQEKNKKPKDKTSKPAKEVGGKSSKVVKETIVASKPEFTGEKRVKDLGEPDTSLPAGWTRKLVERKSGKTAGLIDIYIYSPEGIKFRSRPDVAAYLRKTKSNLKVEDFNFTKRGLSSSVTKSTDEKQRATSKHKGKVTPKMLSKPKKAIHAGSNSPGKRGQKLLVKLNVSIPKKRAISNSASSSKARKKKLALSKSQKQKGTSIAGSKRNK